MATIILTTTSQTFQIDTYPAETLLEALRRNNLPVFGMLLLDENDQPISLAASLDSGATVHAVSMRNADFRIISPKYAYETVPNPIGELFRPEEAANSLTLRQYSRETAMDQVYESVASVLDRHINSRPQSDVPIKLQIALSPGGDGRILAEALSIYKRRHPNVSFFALIVAVGFEDETEHLTEGAILAERFGFTYRTIGVREGADLLGYRESLDSLSSSFREDFPRDEPEMLLTYWVQELNLLVAREMESDAVILGYNQEDVIADHLYSLLLNIRLERYPIRTVNSSIFLAPLYKVPKRLLDAMDLENSKRNYRLRTPSRSYTRSSLYLLSYLIVEKFPALADKFAGDALDVDERQSLESWLQDNSAFRDSTAL